MFNRSHNAGLAVLAIIAQAGASDIATYRFDNTAQDAVTGVPATVVGTEAYTQGKDCDGFDFDGASYVATPLVITLDDASDLSISLWVRFPDGIPDASGQEFVSFERSGGQEIRLFLRRGDENLVASVRSDGGAQHQANVSWRGLLDDGEWHHVAMVREGGLVEQALRLHVDGLEASSTTRSAIGPVNATDPLAIWIGANNYLPGGPDSFTAGVIDEVRIYDHALTAAEIAAECPEPVDCNRDGLVNILDLLCYLSRWFDLSM